MRLIPTAGPVWAAVESYSETARPPAVLGPVAVALACQAGPAAVVGNARAMTVVVGAAPVVCRSRLYLPPETALYGSAAPRTSTVEVVPLIWNRLIDIAPVLKKCTWAASELPSGWTRVRTMTYWPEVPVGSLGTMKVIRASSSAVWTLASFCTRVTPAGGAATRPWLAATLNAAAVAVVQAPPCGAVPQPVVTVRVNESEAFWVSVQVGGV